MYVTLFYSLLYFSNHMFDKCIKHIAHFILKAI